MRVLSCLRVSISPPPPGRGMCERAIDLRRRAGWRFACFLSYRIALSLGARSLSSCLRLGSSSSRASFFLLAWSGLDALSPGPVLASPRVPRPMRFLLRPCFRPVSSVGFGRLVAPCLIVLASAIAWGRVIPSVRSLASLRRCRLSASCPPPASRSLFARFVSCFVPLSRVVGPGRSLPDCLGCRLLACPCVRLC